MTTFPNSGHWATEPPGSWPHIGGHIRQTRYSLYRPHGQQNAAGFSASTFSVQTAELSGIINFGIIGLSIFCRCVFFFDYLRVRHYANVHMLISLMRVKVIKEANFMRSQPRRMSIVQRKWTDVRGDGDWALRKTWLLSPDMDIFKTNSRRTKWGRHIYCWSGCAAQCPGSCTLSGHRNLNINLVSP